MTSHDEVARNLLAFVNGHQDELTPMEVFTLGEASGIITRVSDAPPPAESQDLVPASVELDQLRVQIAARVLRARDEANALVEEKPGVDGLSELAKLYAYALDDIAALARGSR